MQANDDSHVFNLPTPPRKSSLGSKLLWEYDVPQISIPGVEELQMPVMPRLESTLANSLQSVRQGKRSCNIFAVDNIVCHFPACYSRTLQKCQRMEVSMKGSPEFPTWSWMDRPRSSIWGHLVSGRPWKNSAHQRCQTSVPSPRTSVKCVKIIFNPVIATSVVVDHVFVLYFAASA